MAPHRIAQSVSLRLLLTACLSLLAGDFLLCPSAARATTVLCGTALATAAPCEEGDTNAIGILSLQVPGGDSRGYDVEFAFGLPEDLFSLPLPFDTSQEALAAATAVSDALNTLAPEVTTVNQTASDSKDFYEVPFEFRSGVGWLTRTGDYLPSAGEWQPDMDDLGFVPESTPSSFAVFTVVPEPGSALLLGLGVVGLGIVGRSPRAKGIPGDGSDGPGLR